MTDPETPAEDTAPGPNRDTGATTQDGPAAGAPAMLDITGDSAVMRHMGYVVRVFADRTEIDLEIAPHHRNRRGVLHGGILAMLLDSALGYACSRHLAADASTPVVTLSLTTNFLAPATEGVITATGRVTGGGRKTIFAEGAVRNPDGTVAATGTGVFKRVPA